MLTLLNELPLQLALNQPGLSIISPYLLVYGTLRESGTNYNTYLKGKSVTLGTYRLQGYAMYTGLAITPEENSSVVVDLIQITPNVKGPKGKFLKIYEVNCLLDLLEGIYYNSYYTVAGLQIKNPLNEEEDLFAKLYPVLRPTIELGKKVDTGDYNSPNKFIDYPYIKFCD